MSATLAAQPRDNQTGKGAARKLRRTGLVPAVMYSGGTPARSIAVNPQHLVEVFRQTGDRNTVVSLQLGSEQAHCLVREVQRNPLTRQILHVDFYRVAEGQVVEVMVPLAYAGRAAGMAIGGRLRIIRREVLVRCPYNQIPKQVVHDITHLDIGEFVKVSELVVPEGCQVLYEHDYNVMNLYGRRVAANPPAAS